MARRKEGRLKFPKPGKIKKIPLVKLRKKAWDLHSKFVRMEEGKCYTCGKVMRWQDLDAGHFVHKKSLNFVRENIHAQCTTCNRWKHGNLAIYAQKLIEDYGDGIINDLITEGHKAKSFSRDYLEDLISTYTHKIDNLKNGTYTNTKYNTCTAASLVVSPQTYVLPPPTFTIDLAGVIK